MVCLKVVFSKVPYYPGNYFILVFWEICYILFLQDVSLKYEKFGKSHDEIL